MAGAERQSSPPQFSLSRQATTFFALGSKRCMTASSTALLWSLTASPKGSSILLDCTAKQQLLYLTWIVQDHCWGKPPCWDRSHRTVRTWRLGRFPTAGRVSQPLDEFSSTSHWTAHCGGALLPPAEGAANRALHTRGTQRAGTAWHAARGTRHAGTQRSVLHRLACTGQVCACVRACVCVQDLRACTGLPRDRFKLSDLGPRGLG